MNKLEQYLAEQSSIIESALDHLLPKESEYPREIHQAMRYSCLGGGKRLRAVLAMESCQSVGGAGCDALDYACAIEMIHAYSLIHDDLPCMDDDDFRRGKPTNHKVFGEAIAVLAGDALLTYAMQVLAELDLDATLLILLFREVTTAIGSQGLIGGQVADLLSEGKSIQSDNMEYIHENKTGKLFLASIRGGGLIGGATDAQLAAITRYGQNFGLAFQITDDILDIVGDSKKLGKAVGSDLKLAKSTYPGLYGLEESSRMANDCVMQCHQALTSLPGQSCVLRELAQFVLDRDY